MRQFKNLKIKIRKRRSTSEKYYIDGLKNKGCFFFIIKIRFILKGKPKQKKNHKNFLSII